MLVLSPLPTKTAAAHPAPALPPVWDPAPCIVVVDRTVEATAHFAYRVEMDDTVLTVGDIDLPDAMTHQFFAFRGAILFEGFAPEVWSFEPDAPSPVRLPLWITRDDVERAQERSDANGLGYDLSEVTPETTLETMSSLSHRWERITSEQARRPITLDSALLGVNWNVRDVDPGLYTLAGYIFSPPYNGWEVRQGLVKVKDVAFDPPAAVIDRVQESLFGGQGRRVRACLDVPEGTRVRTYARPEEQPDAGWVEWGGEEEVSSGELERCFVPGPGLAGSLRLKFDLVTEGETHTFYSPDTLLVLGGNGACSESPTVCCPAADGGGDAGLGKADARVERASGGCSVGGNGGAANVGWIAVVALLWMRGRDRREREARGFLRADRCCIPARDGDEDGR